MDKEKLRINYRQLCRVREAKMPKSKMLNINYELLARILEAKQKRLAVLGALMMLLISTTTAQTYHILGYNTDTETYTEYLGRLSCDAYSKNSIWNQYSEYGSKYNNKCIWNKYSEFGSDYSPTSWRNGYAKYPPIIVDEKLDYIAPVTQKNLIALMPEN